MIFNLISSVIMNVPGFTDYKELLSLYFLVKNVQNLDGAIVEIGSWCGRSSIVIGRAANTGVFCIDLFPTLDEWQRNPNGSWSIRQKDNAAYTDDFQIWDEAFLDRFKPAYRHNNNILDVFLNNIQHYGLEDKVVALLGSLDSIDIPFSAVKFAFIDGDHDYESVTKDIKLLSGLLIPGGIICIDDVRPDFVGVTRAVNELIVGNDDFINVIKLTRKLLVATKRK